MNAYSSQESTVRVLDENGEFGSSLSAFCVTPLQVPGYRAVLAGATLVLDDRWRGCEGGRLYRRLMY